MCSRRKRFQPVRAFNSEMVCSDVYNTFKEDDFDFDEEDDLSGPDADIKCPHCEVCFSDVLQLREHIAADHRDQPDKYICTKCGAGFLIKAQLDKHLTFHSTSSSVREVCKICQKTFANVYRLQRHMISHNESSDLRKFKCPECTKAFKFKHHLKEHIRIHSGEKPFACPNCGKRFSHSGSYSSHMTSKKCWVVGAANKTPRKDGDSSAKPELGSSPEDALRMTRKGGDEQDQELALTSLYAQQYAQQFIPFDPTGGHLQAQYIAHLNGTRPFLPFNPYSAGHMMTPLIPGLPTNAYWPLLGDKKLPQVNGKHDPFTQLKKELSGVKSKIDENQNSAGTPNSHEKKENSQDSKLSENGDDGHSGDDEKSTDESEKPVNNLDAVQKILKIVDATVNEQQKQKDDKTAISKLTAESEKSGESTDSTPTPAIKQEVEENGDISHIPGVQLPCRYCKQTFDGPVDLHQHERYLCKWNREVQMRDLVGGPAHSSPVPMTPSPGAPERGTSEDEPDNISEASSIDKEGRQYHVRSWFSDEQRQMLKTHYKANPRPDKYELTQISSQLGLPKRVVQVWFQNSRAQDRRKGIPLPPVSAGNSKTSNGTWGSSKSPVTSTPYIPIVPHVPFNGSVQTSSEMPYRGSSIYTSPPITRPTEPVSIQSEPLDLSCRKAPVEAHRNMKSYLSSPSPSDDGEVLNLSQKSRNEDAKKFSSSAIFKYMQQEGLINRENGDHSSNSNRSTPQPLKNGGSRGSTPVPASLPTPRSTPDPYTSISGHPDLPTTTAALLAPTLLHIPPHFVSSPHRASPLLPPPGSPSIPSDLMSPPSSLESSFNSTMSLDSAGLEHNGLFNRAMKRSRRKSWRQVGLPMESEEGIDTEDDEESRAKKRKSWKAHKVDAEEGLYACDQCDKLFSKQSSLARHKYEHSGARPFNCDVCSKSFKHKHHLTEHRRLHSGEKPFQCRKCGKRFSHSGSFSQHMNHRYKYCKPTTDGEDSGTDMGSTLASGDLQTGDSQSGSDIMPSTGSDILSQFSYGKPLAEGGETTPLVEEEEEEDTTSSVNASSDQQSNTDQQSESSDNPATESAEQTGLAMAEQPQTVVA